MFLVIHSVLACYSFNESTRENETFIDYYSRFLIRALKTKNDSCTGITAKEPIAFYKDSTKVRLFMLCFLSPIAKPGGTAQDLKVR